MKGIVYLFMFWKTLTGVSGEWCYHSHYEYCTDGCCTNSCCEDVDFDVDIEDETWLVPAITGAVIGCILLISFIICILCVVMKQKGKQGRVIQPDQNMMQPPPYTTAAAYTTVPYPQQLLAHQSLQNPPPAFPPVRRNHAAPSTDNTPEGIQSAPPASSGLPQNHKVV